MSAETTALSVALPEVLVADIVKAEIVRHLGKRDELIASIIDSVTKQECKCDTHRYSQPKKTVFACHLEKQIEACIKDILAGWIAENRETFKAELQKRLAKPDQLKALVSVVRGWHPDRFVGRQRAVEAEGRVGADAARKG